jgi:hypothetical protein
MNMGSQCIGTIWSEWLADDGTWQTTRVRVGPERVAAQLAEVPLWSVTMQAVTVVQPWTNNADMQF